MAKQLQLRKGTTTEHNTFTGAVGEVTVDTTKKTLVVHDGVTAGGTPLLNASQLVDSTTTVKGVTRFATATEVANKSNVSAAVTPKNVADMFVGTFDQDGSLTLPSGHILKWGVTSHGDIAYTTDFNISFPAAFPNALFSIVANEGGIQPCVINVINKTKSSFTARVTELNTNVATGNINWFAIGY